MQPARRPPTLLAAGIASLALLAGGAALFASILGHPHYSPDSWMYWDLAKSLTHAPYQLSIRRSYQDVLPWSDAFPPLWPALNALVAWLLGTGPVTLIVTNVAVFLGFCVASAAAGRAVFGSVLPGLLAALLMLTDPSWVDELVSGRPIPFQLALLAGLLATLAAELAPAVRHALAGLLCGLMLATKFDYAPLVAIVFLLLLFEGGERRSLVLFVLLAVLPPLPWIWFSFTHFGRLFASDGSAIAASTDPTAFTTDFRLSWHPTLADDPVGWVRKVLINVHRLSWTLRRSWSAPELVLAGLGAASAWGLWRARRRGAVPAGLSAFGFAEPSLRFGGRRWLRLARPSRALLIVSAGVIASFASYLATGFVDDRYLAPLRYLVALASFAAIGRLLLLWRPSQLAPAASLAALVLLAWAAAPTLGREWALRPAPDFAQPPSNAALLACLDAIGPTRLLVLDDDEAAARLAAQTGRPTGMVPANLDALPDPALATFLSRYGFGAVSWHTPHGAARARRLGALPVPGCSQVAALPAAQLHDVDASSEH